MASIVLKEVGPNKVTVIKIVREATGLGLKEAKDAVDAVDFGIPFEMQISSENADRIRDELLNIGAVITDNKPDRYAKHRNHQDENTTKTHTTVETPVNTMNREQTMQTLYEVGRIAETYEELTSEQSMVRKNIKIEKDKAEGLRKVVSAGAKALKWIAILCSFITWIFLSFYGLAVTIVVWVAMNKTVIKKDLIKHADENNANADRHLKEVVMPLETRLQEINAELEELRTSGKIEWAKDIVGDNMFYSQCIGDLYDLIKNRRADSLKEALNLYDDNQYKARMEASQAAIQNATEVAAAESVKQTAYAKETAKNTHQTATATKATAYHTRQIQRNTRRFR